MPNSQRQLQPESPPGLNAVRMFSSAALASPAKRRQLVREP